MLKFLLRVLIIVVIIIIIIVSIVTIGNIVFNRQVNADVAEMFANRTKIPPQIVTEKDLRGLPEPVQRWLLYSRVTGEEKITTVRLKQDGFFRLKKDSKWLPFKAEEYFTVDPPAFIWYTTMNVAPFFFIKGRDRYFDGNGNILIKLWSLITVAKASGDEINQGTLVRFLNEMMWFPSAALSDYITWVPIDSTSAEAKMSYMGNTASAIFHFNKQGAITNITASRYMKRDGNFTLEKWSTPISEYGEFNGIRIPIKGEGEWNLESGDFSYIKVNVKDVEYNNATVY